MKIIRQFLDEVVQPNMQAALEEPSHLRLAVNAVLTIDSLAGVIFAAMRETGHDRVAGLKTDDAFRDQLAGECHEFRVLRDLAAAYKHGELTNPKPKQPRLLRDPGDVSEVPNTLGVFQCGDRLGSSVLIIELDGGAYLRASNAIARSYRLLLPLVEEVEAQSG